MSRHNPVSRPVPTDASPWSFPTPHRFPVGEHGLRGLAYNLPGQHVISVSVGVPLPISFEPRGTEGVARLAAHMLTEGTQSLPTAEFIAAGERLGAMMGAMAGEKSITFDMQVPARNLVPALELMWECLTEPALGEPELDLALRQSLSSIDHARAHPAHRAGMELAALMFDENDRLHLPYSGTTESVGAITRADVADYVGSLGPTRSVVVIAGDLAGIDVESVLTDAFGQWTDGSRRPAQVEALGRYAPDWERIVVVDRPGSVQSELRIACPGPGRNVEGGWAPFPVLAYLMGGTTTSRLDAELRENRGYTYGVRAGFTPRDSGGLFQVSGSVRSEVTADAMRVALDILAQAADGFGEDETARGVGYLVKTAPAGYATADQVTDEAIARYLAGSDTDEVTRVLADTATLTPERLTEAWNRHITGDWGVVVLGDAETFVDELRELGPVTVR